VLKRVEYKLYKLFKLENHSLVGLSSDPLDIERVKILLILDSAGNVSDNLLEIALLRLVHLFLVLNLEVEKDAMVDLALVPGPLVIEEALNWGRVEE